MAETLNAGMTDGVNVGFDADVAVDVDDRSCCWQVESRRWSIQFVEREESMGYR
jgi:hypothetical protein